MTMASRVPKRPAAPAAPASPAASKPLWLLYVISWLVPGAGHLWLGRQGKGLVFLITLTAMFAIGLVLQGRLFPVTSVGEPLVLLAAIADLGVGLPHAVARLIGAGAGEVRALTYEYGNAFIITAGLLNALVVIDAHDIALGRK
jgi:hypothetical protein